MSVAVHVLNVSSPCNLLDSICIRMLYLRHSGVTVFHNNVAAISCRMVILLLAMLTLADFHQDTDDATGLIITLIYTRSLCRVFDWKISSPRFSHDLTLA